MAIPKKVKARMGERGIEERGRDGMEREKSEREE